MLHTEIENTTVRSPRSLEIVYKAIEVSSFISFEFPKKWILHVILIDFAVHFAGTKSKILG